MESKPDKSAVALRDVAVAFRLAGGAGFTAVERATLEVADGEFVAIVGPTGCGKSTLLNIAAGLMPPSAGTVDIFGQPLGALNRQAGYLFQADALFPVEDRAGERRHRAGDRRHGAQRGARARAARGSSAWASAPSATAIRTCSPAASASAWGWRKC